MGRLYWFVWARGFDVLLEALEDECPEARGCFDQRELGSLQKAAGYKN